MIVPTFSIQQLVILQLLLMKLLKRIPLYVQVLIAILVAVIFGVLAPQVAETMKPLGDAFIKLVKMCIAPIIFCTVVSGMIADSKLKLGRLGLKALIYFEILTTVALFIGFFVAHYFKPGLGMNADLASLDPSNLGHYVEKPKEVGFIAFLLNIIPTTLFQAFTSGEILPVLFVALLFGVVLKSIKDQVPLVVKGIDELSHIIMKIINILVKLAPIGAFGAMSYTIGKYGVGALMPLMKLMLTFYTTCILFIIIALGLILKICGSSIFKLLYHIKEEIFLTLGTSSSETALPGLIKKMEKFGCEKSVVGFVIPAGYAFNLDGTCLYFMMAVIFIAQAFNIDLSMMQILSLMVVLLFTSKGAAAVVGSAFVTLAATLMIMPTVPFAGLVLILGIDRFMAEARSVTNLIGNATATVAIAKWEKEFHPHNPSTPR
jgi:aerobic C4-dicarboxylate transport protein